ncbi:hypothetical protein BLOT_004916 [Blomia tropicalis]|nr:hypothetical protein BLOT_004916 [Blomia tropicalis]
MGCNCLDSPEGDRRTFRNRILKLIFILFFMMASSQLFSMFYHFIRLVCYLFLDPHQFPPKPLPKRISMFGVDLLQFETTGSDNVTLLYVMQAVTASIIAIIIGTTGLNAICRENVRMLRITSIILGIVVFFTAFGTISFPGMMPIQQLFLPLIGGCIDVTAMLAFSLIFPIEPNYRYYAYYRP